MPLAGNTDLFLSADFPVYVVLNGIEDKLELNHGSVHKATPPFDYISDEEIATVLSFVLSSWSNDALRSAGMKDPDAAEGPNIRSKAMDASGVGKLRESLLK